MERVSASKGESRGLVSVIIPTYNRVRLLEGTVRSVLDQTYHNLEVLVIADGHQPDVVEMLSRFQDARIKYLSRQRVGYPSAVRNFGLSVAHGEYLAFCDDDDAWEPEKLSAQLDLMNRQKVDFCFTSFRYIDNEGKCIGNPRIRVVDRTAVEFGTFVVSFGVILNSSVVVTKNVLDRVGGFDEDPKLRSVEDFEMWSRALCTFPAYYIDSALVRYRVSASSSIQPQSCNAWLKKQIYLLRVIASKNNLDIWIYLLKFVRILAKYLAMVVNILVPVQQAPRRCLPD